MIISRRVKPAAPLANRDRGVAEDIEVLVNRYAYEEM
jgi:hypothetical protein